jgi:hypothetical protein
VNLQNDPNGCGACGHSCMGGACIGGVCQPVLVATMASPDQLFGDASNLYVRSGGTTVVQLTKGGVLGSSNSYSWVSIFGTDSSNVYVLTPGGPNALESIWKGSSLATLLYTGNMVDYCLSGSVLAWVNDGHNLNVGPATGGASAVKYTTAGNMDGLVCDLGGVVTIEGFGNSVYMYEHNQSFSTNTQLSVPSGHIPDFVVLDPTNAYWPDSTSNVIWKSARSGSAAVQLATGVHWGTALAFDATNVYWSDTTAGTISSVPIAGGAKSLVATAYANGLYVDDKAIYWADSNGGRVMRVAK